LAQVTGGVISMKEFIRKNSNAYIIGIATYIVLSTISWLYWEFLVSNGIVKINFDHSLGAQTWNNHPLLIFSTIISILILILPGYLAGWYSNQNATLNGLIVIFVCTSVKFFGSSVVWKNFYFSYSEFYFLLRPWFESLLLPIFVGAMCGAAGQYHSKRKKGFITKRCT
jgi:hypothetical protein